MQPIKTGAKVAIIAPCGQIGEMSKIAPAVEYLKSLGLQPVAGEHLLCVNRYMAGTDEQRAADINAAFADDEIKAVFCVRAAAGGLRVLPYLDYDLIKRNPKPFIGFCDNASVQLALWQKCGLVSYNGFVLTYDFKDGALDSLIKEDLEKLLQGKIFTVVSGQNLRSGIAKGKLICSNLTTLLRLAGTPYFPDLSDKILLIEDINERVYRLDLMLQQLKLQPSFKHLKGIIFGQFTNSQTDDEDGSVADCVQDFLSHTNLPAISDFNFGHTKSRHVLPMGAEVEMNADKAELKILRY